MNRRDFMRGGIKGTAAYTLLASTLLGSHKVMARGRSDSGSNTPTTEEEQEHLAYMREEEKLARDVYLTMYDTWGMAVFYNIAQSEQIHTDAVKAKIEKYGLVDPVIDDTVGAFQNQDLAVLYDALIHQGNVQLMHFGLEVLSRRLILSTCSMQSTMLNMMILPGSIRICRWVHTITCEPSLPSSSRTALNTRRST